MTRRMILPDRVLGMSGTIQTFFGRAILPICGLDRLADLVLHSWLASNPGFSDDVQLHGPGP